MPSLKDIVAALQRELDAAFAEAKAGSTGTAMEVEKVTLSLALELLEKNASTGEPGLGLVVLDGAKAAKSSGHRLTIELRASRATASIAVTPATAAVIPPPPKAESVFELASRVFGPPGFDNAARAEVFCESIKELTEAAHPYGVGVGHGQRAARREGAVGRRSRPNPATAPLLAGGRIRRCCGLGRNLAAIPDKRDPPDHLKPLEDDDRLAAN